MCGRVRGLYELEGLDSVCVLHEEPVCDGDANRVKRKVCDVELI